MRWNRLAILMLCVAVALAGPACGKKAEEQPAPAEQPAAQEEHPATEEHPAGEEHKAGEEHPEGEAAEHPEGKEAEHPEGTSDQKNGSPSSGHNGHPAVTLEDIAVHVEKDAAAQAAAQGGWITIRDDVAGGDLKFRIDKVHRERLAKTAEATYFVCADFKTPEGKVYDLDFWVMATDQGLKTTETMIHKEEGKPRYTWAEESGIWVRKPL